METPTPKTDEAYFCPGATMYSLAGEMKILERENTQLKAQMNTEKEKRDNVIKLNTPDQQEEADPPLSRILPPVPDDVDCQGLLFVGAGQSCNIGKQGLRCLKQLYDNGLMSVIRYRSGYHQSSLYAIDLSCPIEEVNEALSRFGFDTLDRVYYPMSSLPKSGLVQALFRGRGEVFETLADYEIVHRTCPSPLWLGWRPADGIKGAE